MTYTSLAARMLQATMRDVQKRHPNDLAFAPVTEQSAPATMKTWTLFWSPTGAPIATVQARTARAAIRKAPQPYRRYLGEIYAKEGAQ